MNDFFEKTLEDIIIRNKEECVKRGFPNFYKLTFRQFSLPSGAIIDLISFEENNKVFNCKIFELKRETVNLSSVLQAVRYSKELLVCLNSFFQKVNIELIVVGSQMDECLYELGMWGVGVKVVIYDYKVDGIKFELFDFTTPTISEIYTSSFELPKEPTEFINSIYSVLAIADEKEEALLTTQQTPTN